MRLLVIGYGNELRGDDGVGPRVARAVEAWGLPGVAALSAHGLVPELAEPLSQAEMAVFVDAGEGGLEVIELTPGPASSLGHASDPRWLLALTEALYGRRPRAWLIRVPAADFGLGEGLSTAAGQGMAAALDRVRELCGSDTVSGTLPHIHRSEPNAPARGRPPAT